jgi:predicted O-methyltransferase YrrM
MSGYLDLTRPEVAHYLAHETTRETPLQRRLYEETRSMPRGGMLSSPDEVQLLALLVRLTGAKRVLEIGTFTGYSALAMALALPEDGRLTALDISEEWTNIGRRYWQEAGVARKIDLRIGPAAASLAALEKDGASFDMVYIDADKEGYDAYYEACLALLRPGGLIALDNMLWGGDVTNANCTGADARALRALNAKIREDARVDMCLASVADGLMLARKREAHAGV